MYVDIEYEIKKDISNMYGNILFIIIQRCAHNFQCYTYKYKSKGQ